MLQPADVAANATTVPTGWGDDVPVLSDVVVHRGPGIAVFDDPKNPSRAAWHSRGYGLMAANPFGRSVSRFPAVKGRNDLVQLARGEHLRLRYGILVHSGDAAEGQVAEHFQRFVKLRSE